MPATPEPRRPRWRRWRIIAAAIAALALIVFAGIHLPFARARVLSWVSAELGKRGISFKADHLRYNLFSLTVGLDRVAVAATGSEPPFFEADAVRLNLPLAALGGTLRVQSIEIDRPRLRVVRNADGSWNLPRSTSPAAEGPMLSGPLELDRVVIHNLAVEYTDAVQGIALGSRAISLDLHRAPGQALAGRLTMAERASLRQGDRATTATLQGPLSFDGETVSIEALDLAALEGRARIAGTIGKFTGEPRLNLKIDTDLDVERVMTWLAVVSSPPTGRIAAQASLTGPLAAVRVEIHTTSESLVWPAVGALSLETRATIAAGAAEIASLRVGLGAGEIEATGRVALDTEGRSEANVRWRHLDVGALARTGATLPIRPAAIADGDLALSWTGQDVFGGRGRLETSLREAAASPKGLSLAGRIEASVKDRRWTVTTDSVVGRAVAVAVNVGGRLGETLATSTIDGRTTLRAADLEVALRRLKDAGLDLGAVAVAGAATAAIDVGGTFNAPRAAGALEASGLKMADTGPAEASVRFSTTTTRLTLEQVQLSLAANVITANGGLDFETRALNGQFDGSLPQLSALGAALPEFWRPDGTGRIGGRLGGTLASPVVDMTVAADNVRLAGQPIDTVRSTLRLAGGTVNISAFEAAQKEGRLSVTGQYTFNSRRYGLNVIGTALAIDQAPLWARVNLRLSGAGVIDRPEAAGALEFSRLELGEYSLAPVYTELSLSNNRLQTRSIVPTLGGQVDATVDLDARTISATAAVVNADLATVASAVHANRRPGETPGTGPIALAGSASFRATASGSLDDVNAIAVGTELSSVDATVNGVPVRLARPATVRHEKGQIVANDLELRVGGSAITANGRLGAPKDSGEALRVEVAGSVSDVLALARLAPDLSGVEAAGTIALRVLASGPIRTPDVTGSFTLREASVKTADLPPITSIGVTAAYADGRLDVTQIGGRWQGAEISGTAQLPIGVLGQTLPGEYLASLSGASGPAAATVKVSSITSEAMAPFVDRATVDQIAGQIDLVATLQAASLNAESVTGNVTLEHAEMELGRVPLRQAVPTRLRLANRRIDVESWRWSGGGSQLDVTGSVRLADDAPELDVGVAGTVDLRMLGAFMPDVAVVGLAKVDVRAMGRANDPRVEGKIDVADTDVILRNPRIAITGLQGGAILSERRLQLRDVTAAANGGQLRAEGTIEYGSSPQAGGRVTVTGRGMAFELIDGLRTDIDADLTLSMAGDNRSIGGRVTILRGDYRRRIRLTDFIGRSRAAAIAPSATEPGPLDALRFDVSIVTADDIVVDNNYGRFEASSQLNLVGTVAEPALAGRLALREGGRVFLGGRTYSVRRGTIAFTNPTMIEPQLDVALETRVQQNDITLEVTGTPDALDVGLRSPGLSQQDAVSLLLTGQLADETAVAYSEIAQGQLLMLLSGEILGAAGQAIGLDSVQVSQGLGAAASTFDLLSTESNPDARLTLSKKLRRDVELIMSQNLRKSGDITWILAYQPTRRIDLRAATDDDDSRTYEFRHEVPFGGGARPAAESVRPASIPSPRIAGVEVRGAPEALEAELRNGLRLEAGDRFDFFRWQEDRDRLARTLRERGFLEARIAARRQDTGADEIVLTYDITSGPRTTLEVEGFTLPASSIAEIKAVWAETLFDEFLKEDVTTVARRALVAAKHLKSAVVTTVRQPAGNEKSVLVSIVPGPQFVERRIAFEGNKDVTSATLAEVVHEHDLGVEAWLDQKRLTTALVDSYRSLGYLGASITVEPPRFEGTSAILPVRIEEGPQFRIGEVRVGGATSPTADEVRATFGLEPGAAYRPPAVDPAERKVEAAYLRRGYNKVRVRVTAAADRTQARVDLSLAIDPGPQEVLETVEVSGAETTSPGIINRVLKLPVGKPVGLGDVYSAQKRLYDTGVFQSVDVSLVPVTAGPAAASVQPVRAAVTLRELPRFRLRYGFRLTDVVEPGADVREIHPGFVTDLLDRNLFGRAIAAGIAGQVETDRALGRAFVSLPSLFNRAVVTNVFLTQSREEVAPAGETAFIDRTLEFTVEQKLKPKTKMAVTYGLSFGRKHIYEPDPDPDSLLPPIDFRTNITRATGTFAWDTRDDPSDASRGWFHSSGVEYGVEALGSDLRFIRYLAQQYYVKRAANRIVLASAVRFGAARGFEQELIPSERFYAGGGTSVRGFAEDALGTFSILGEPEGGDGLLVFNQEVRIRAHKWIGAVAFVDAGNVFPNARDISFSNLEAGAGFGLRVISPFAILRVDFGMPLTSRQTQPAGRWYFGIGHTF
jgi:outer membrane protein assembly factor BamA/autotransporter translocation and assembly factor TamB